MADTVAIAVDPIADTENHIDDPISNPPMADTVAVAMDRIPDTEDPIEEPISDRPNMDQGKKDAAKLIPPGEPPGGLLSPSPCHFGVIKVRFDVGNFLSYGFWNS